jgi:hypothetical protein
LGAGFGVRWVSNSCLGEPGWPGAALQAICRICEVWGTRHLWKGKGKQMQVLRLRSGSPHPSFGLGWRLEGYLTGMFRWDVFCAWIPGWESECDPGPDRATAHFGHGGEDSLQLDKEASWADQEGCAQGGPIR